MKFRKDFSMYVNVLKCILSVTYVVDNVMENIHLCMKDAYSYQNLCLPMIYPFSDHCAGDAKCQHKKNAWPGSHG